VSPLPGNLPGRSPRRRRARPGVAGLEDRTLLSGSPEAFAAFSGVLTRSEPRAAIAMTVSPADFALGSGRVVLDLAMHGGDRLAIVADGRAAVRTLACGAGTGHTLATLDAGRYALIVSAASGRDPLPYQVTVSLAGDTNGDFQVTRTNLAAIRGLKGRRRGEPTYLAGADVNHDGRIGPRDLALARRNLGVATSIRPLAVTLGLAPSGGAVVYQSDMTVAGQTTPGAVVRLGQNSTTADATGHYQFTINAAVGSNPLQVVASDGFGQHASAALDVTRAVDSQPPALMIATPTAGLTTNANVLVSGQVTDDRSGVAALQEQIDSGAFQPVAFDSSGHFAFATTLPLNGSADGLHTVHVQAVDAVGNLSDAFVRFGLDTTGPTITVTSPTAGATVSDSPVVTGTVADNLAGVNTLLGRVDSGAFQAVAVDAEGDFSVPTNLALDGTADGAHTVEFRATDRAGNVTDVADSFTLTTTLVNRAITTDPGVQQMPSIAADPLDPTHLVLAYMDYSLVKTGYAGIGVAVSHDSGAAWQSTSVPLPAGFDQGAANPIVKFDGQGHVFVSFMAVTFKGPRPAQTNPGFFQRGLPGTQSNNGIFVARSDDGGLTWNQPVAVIAHTYAGQPVDFEITPDLAIDTFPTLPDGSANPQYGELYETWTRA
jgi:hypothetical protein